MPIVSAIVGAATAIGTAISATFTAISGFTVAGFSVGKALLQVGLAVGLQAVAGALSPRPTESAPRPGAIQSEVQIGGDIPRQVVMGRNAVKGQFAYAHTYGAGNAALQMVYILSDGWCGPISRIRVNDTTVSIGAAGSAGGGKATGLVSLTPTHGEVQRLGVTGFGTGGAAGAGEPSFIIQYFDGRPGQAAHSGLVSRSATASSKPGTLTSADRFAGQAYVVVTMWRDRGNFDAIPEMLFEFEGYRCYDPRKDSTAGGTGLHRLADPATWQTTDNPSVHIYNYIVGIQSEGQSFLGVQAPAYDVMTDLFISAANICDEAVTLEGGGTEPRYGSAHVIAATDADHRSQIAPMVQAMAGYLVERGGRFGVVAGAAQMAVATITDNDIVWDRGVEWSASKSRLNRINEVYGQFTDPNAGWQGNSYPPERSAGDLAYDGERLAVSFDLAAVQSVTQAQRIARIRRRETRRESTSTLALGFAYCWLDAGDWITWNSGIFNTARIYRIMSRDLNADDTVTLDLQEVGNEIYSWTAADERPYTAPPTSPAEPPLASTVSEFAVQADVVADRAVVRATWAAITDTRITAVIIEYRPVGTTNATRVRDDSPYDGVFIIDQPPTGANYEFRATIVTAPARISTWTGWVSLAPIPTFGPGSINFETLAAGLFSRVDQQARDADAAFDLLLQEAGAVRETSTLVDQRVTMGIATARVIDTVTTVVSEQAAMATRITGVEAVADGAVATATTAQEVVATTESALATLTASTNAAFGGNVAGTTARFSSFANAGITEAGYQLLAFNTINNVTYSVGLTAYAGPAGRGVILGGDGATVLLDGDSTVVNGTLQGPNGRMQIRLENNTLKVFDAAGVLRVHIGDLTQ